MLLTLFPGVRPEFVEEISEMDDCVILAVRDTKKSIWGEAVVRVGGVQHTARAKTPFSEDPLLYKRNAQQAQKLAFYRAALPFLERRPPWGAMTGIRPAKLAARLFAEGNDATGVDRILKNGYYVTARRRALAIDVARAGDAVRKRNGRMDASVYLGIPFCVSRCSYCSFVSHSIDRAGHLVEPYLHALFWEMEHTGRVARELGLSIKTIYIGGGTPTALNEDQLARLLAAVEQNFDVSSLLEYTVEAGRPDTMNAEKLRIIKDAGATRISINPQTMEDAVLEAIGRKHTAQDVVEQVAATRALGGLAINMDLIAGLPGDTPAGFAKTLKKTLALEPENLTVHTLAMKRGATLHEQGAPQPDGTAVAQMVDLAAKTLPRHGYAPYYLYRQKYMAGNLENVGYTRPGYEGLYNIFIMEEIHSILSLGAGGVSKLVCPETGKLIRIFNPKYPYEYNGARDRLAGNAEQIRAFYEEEF